MNKINISIYLVIILTSNFCFGQSKDFKGIIDSITSINRIEHEYTGIAGKEGNNYKNFLKLKESASTKELVQLTKSSNPTLACYASWGLADNSYSELKSIFKQFLLENRRAETFSGCILSEDFISSVLYHWYWNRIDVNERKNDKILQELDSIILFSDSVYWLLLTRALDNRIYSEPYKSQIAKFAFDKGYDEAIFYLSNWHKAEYYDKIKYALIKYLNDTDFSTTGTTNYYKTVDELLKFKNKEINEIVINKLKKDKHWKREKENFMYLLSMYSIYGL
ncbi:MAG: hypothetical protein H6Q15_1090 [Bacteroidetes bacterium]|nr:hypothetical protein [Bacteroidota bacterium]